MYFPRVKPSALHGTGAVINKLIVNRIGLSFSEQMDKPEFPGRDDNDWIMIMILIPSQFVEQISSSILLPGQDAPPLQNLCRDLLHSDQVSHCDHSPPIALSFVGPVVGLIAELKKRGLLKGNRRFTDFFFRLY